MYTIYRTYRTMSKTGEETNMNYSKDFTKLPSKWNRKRISLVSIQQHLSMKVLFLQMVLAFAKLQYYIPGKSLNKNFRRLFVSLPQFLGYFNDPAINNNIVINGFIDH